MASNQIELLVVPRHALDGMKERLQVFAGMLGVLGGKARLLVRVVHVVAGIPRAVLPATGRIVEAIPDFDLHKDVPLGGPLEHILKSLPVLLIPLIEVELSVRQQLVRLQLDLLPLAHRQRT